MLSATALRVQIVSTKNAPDPLARWTSATVTYFKIQCARGAATWVVERRFRSFAEMRARLAQDLDSSVELPSLPPKLLSHSPEAIATRWLELEAFLQACLRNPMVAESPGLYHFLTEEWASIPSAMSPTRVHVASPSSEGVAAGASAAIVTGARLTTLLAEDASERADATARQANASFAVAAERAGTAQERARAAEHAAAQAEDAHAASTADAEARARDAAAARAEMLERLAAMEARAEAAEAKAQSAQEELLLMAIERSDQLMTVGERADVQRERTTALAAAVAGETEARAAAKAASAREASVAREALAATHAHALEHQRTIVKLRELHRNELTAAVARTLQEAAAAKQAAVDEARRFEREQSERREQSTAAHVQPPADDSELREIVEELRGRVRDANDANERLVAEAGQRESMLAEAIARAEAAEASAATEAAATAAALAAAEVARAEADETCSRVQAAAREQQQAAAEAARVQRMRSATADVRVAQAEAQVAARMAADIELARGQAQQAEASATAARAEAAEATRTLAEAERRMADTLAEEQKRAASFEVAANEAAARAAVAEARTREEAAAAEHGAAESAVLEYAHEVGIRLDGANGSHDLVFEYQHSPSGHTHVSRHPDVVVATDALQPPAEEAGSLQMRDRSTSMSDTIEDLSSTQVQHLWLAKLVEACEDDEAASADEDGEEEEEESDEDPASDLPLDFVGTPGLCEPSEELPARKTRRRSLTQVSRKTVRKVSKWLSRRWPGGPPTSPSAKPPTPPPSTPWAPPSTPRQSSAAPGPADAGVDIDVLRQQLEDEQAALRQKRVEREERRRRRQRELAEASVAMSIEPSPSKAFNVALPSMDAFS